MMMMMMMMVREKFRVYVRVNFFVAVGPDQFRRDLKAHLFV